MFVAQYAMPQRESTLYLNVRFLVKTKVDVGIADGLADRRFNQRLMIKLARDTHSSTIESGTHLQVRAGLDVRSSLYTRAGLGQEIILQELIDRSGNGRFVVGAVSFAHGGDQPCD